MWQNIETSKLGFGVIINILEIFSLLFILRGGPRISAGYPSDGKWVIPADLLLLDEILEEKV